MINQRYFLLFVLFSCIAPYVVSMDNIEMEKKKKRHAKHYKRKRDEGFFNENAQYAQKENPMVKSAKIENNKDNKSVGNAKKITSKDNRLVGTPQKLAQCVVQKRQKAQLNAMYKKRILVTLDDSLCESTSSYTDSGDNSIILDIETIEEMKRNNAL